MSVYSTSLPSRCSPLLPILATVALLLSADAGHAQTLVEAGIPALGREWSGSDYKQAADVIASGKVPLPTLASDEGRAFLQRLTSTDNLSMALNRNLPINARMDEFANLLNGPRPILMEYLKAANKGSSVHTEIAMQMAFMLHVAETGILLADEFIPTIAKDEKYEVRIAGLKKMYSGLTTVFVGSETSLGESSFYSLEDLSLLLQTMADVLPTIRKAFPPDYRVELRKKLEARKASFPAAKDAANLQKMIGELSS